MRLVIVGGVAGGASAAARARRLSEAAQIVVFERGPDVSFANCGMPYYVGDEIQDRQKLLVVTPERLRTRFRLDVRTQTEVVALDRARKVVVARELATGREYEQPYDKLILSPGAAPLRPNLPGLDLPGIHTLRNLQDMDRIKQACNDGAQRAVVVGAGFIGLEMVENFVRRGMHVTLVELADQILPPLDAELAAPLVAELREHGVELLLSQAAAGFAPAERGVQVQLQSGLSLPADLVILGIGVRPETQLAAAAGLELNPRGAIRVNAQQQSSDPDVYAVGDATEVRDFVTGEPAYVPLAGPANRQGRIAADHALGRASSFRGVQGTSIVRVFSLTAATTGASEKTLRRLQREFRKVYVHPAQHASYFPQAEQMTLKLLFEPPEGRILGAQIVGRDGVDKRIDVLALAIQAGLTVYDLEEAELAYAPPYGSAKDPVNMAGFVAAGLLRGDHPQANVDALALDDVTLVDVRTPNEFAAGHVPGARLIPIDDLRARLGEIPRERPVVVYCQVGQRGYLATRILLQAGYDVRNLAGGYKTYRLFHP